MTHEDALRLFDAAIGDAFRKSDAITNVVEQIQQSGYVIEDFELTLSLLLKPQPVPPGISDADFLREMHIVPELTPRKRRRHFARWPGKRWSLAVLFSILMLLPAFTGCADIRVDLGCQPGAPTITSAPSHTNQRHPVCGLQKGQR